MELTSKDYACPSCGATLKYSPQRQKLYCDRCETCVDIQKQPIIEKYKWEDLNKYNINTMDNSDEKRTLKCVSCGARIKLNKYEYSGKCEYCGNNIVGIFKEKNKLIPNAIIPFKYSLEDAGKMMAKGIANSKMFVPTELKKRFPVENIKGVYFPSFSYDAHSESDYNGVLAYTETYYSFGERKTRTVYKDISGHHSLDLTDVVVESSSKLTQIEMNKMGTYNFEERVKFDDGFILGYNVEDYEKTAQECKEVALNMMKENIKKSILKQYRSGRVCSFNLTTKYFDEKFTYCLLPLYECEYTYKNKKYKIIMNGQTGKIAGEVPKSGKKIALFVIGIVVVSLLALLPVIIFFLDSFLSALYY